jgi:hypothetical protein
MNAHKIAATLTQDGTLVLQGLPFQAGDRVEVVILEQSQTPVETQSPAANYPLQGKQPYRYDEPTEPVGDADYLNAVAATLTEWDSEADEQAYQTL